MYSKVEKVEILDERKFFRQEFRGFPGATPGLKKGNPQFPSFYLYSQGRLLWTRLIWKSFIMN